MLREHDLFWALPKLPFPPTGLDATQVRKIAVIVKEWERNEVHIYIRGRLPSEAL